jgi:hypothetical protein
LRGQTILLAPPLSPAVPLRVLCSWLSFSSCRCLGGACRAGLDDGGGGGEGWSWHLWNDRGRLSEECALCESVLALILLLKQLLVEWVAWRLREMGRHPPLLLVV